LEKFRQTLKVKKERAILVAALLSRSNGSDDLAESDDHEHVESAQCIDRDYTL